MAEQEIGGLRVQLSLDAQEAVKQMGAATARIEAQAKAMSTGFAGFQRSVQAAFAPILGLKAIVMSLAVGGFALAVKGALDMGGVLTDLRDKTGIGTDALQEYRFAFGQVGVGAAEADSALEKFTANVGDARNGVGPLIAALKDTNREFLETIRTAPTMDAALDAAFQQLAAIPDAAQRAALAQDLFGKQGVKLAAVAAQGADGLAAMRQQARDLGLVLSEDILNSADAAGDQIAALAQTVDTQMKRALIALAPAISAVTEALSGMAVAAGKTLFGEHMGLEQLTARMAGLNAQREALVAAGGFAKAISLGAVDKEIAQVQGLIAKEVELIAKKQAEADARKSNVKELKSEGDERTRLDIALGKEIEKTELLLGAMDDTRDKRIAAANKDAFDTSQEKRLMDAEFLAEAYADGSLNVEAYTLEMEKLKDTVADTRNEASQTADVMRQLGLTFGDAFADAIVDGKKLHEVLQALERDLLRLAVRGMVTQAIAGMFSGGGGATGGGDAMIGGINAGPRAMGGPVSPGHAYIVGEEGAELFMPRVPGSIVPNSQLGGGNTLNFDFRGADSSVIPRVEAMIRAAAPQIVAQSVAAVSNERKRGGRI